MPIRWFVQRLQSHPWSTNLTTAAFVMTIGDVGAQYLEHSHIQEQEESTSVRPVKLQSRRTVQYRLYGNLSPPVEQVQHELHEQHQQHLQQERQASSLPLLLKMTLTDWQDEQQLAWRSYDAFRTATMVSWASLVYTPYFMGLFQLYGRFLPASLPHPAIWRAVLTYTASIPLTTAFFAYGCTIHHVTTTRIQNNNNNNPMAAAVPNQDKSNDAIILTDLITAIQTKLRAELATTLQASAAIWIPINYANFALVPPHWRSICLMFVAVFWNGYLSLAQHRNVDIN